MLTLNVTLKRKKKENEIEITLKRWRKKKKRVANANAFVSYEFFFSRYRRRFFHVLGKTASIIFTIVVSRLIDASVRAEGDKLDLL